MVTSACAGGNRDIDYDCLYFSAKLALKNRREEKNRTAPKKGTNTHAAFVSGTTGMCLPFPLPSFPLPLFVPLLPFPLSLPAYARAGRTKVTATKAQVLQSACGELLVVPCLFGPRSPSWSCTCRWVGFPKRRPRAGLSTRTRNRTRDHSPARIRRSRDRDHIRIRRRKDTEPGQGSAVPTMD